ncbi:ATP-binding cassette domain-containing protein, partial [bacterium]|nr:ATP-binding cassette domain-containing protein [bacterium]
MEMLKVQNLTLTLDGREILDNLTMSITAGRIHAIVGPNGAGKSSLAYAIMGLEGYREIEGDIIFEGESIKGLSIDERARRGITLAWQEPARFEGLSVRQFILAAAKEKSTDIVKQALERVGLGPEYINRAVDK